MSPTSRWRSRLMVVAVLAIVLPIGAAVLYHFPPGEYDFYPRCMLQSWTGLYCPGCGGTRCIGALVRADLPQAMAYNALLVVLLPFGAVMSFAMAYRDWTGRRLLPRMPQWAITTLVWLIILFGVLRNVDVYPLTLLAPHVL